MKPKPSPKRRKLPEEVRRGAILTAAHRLFSQKGFQRTRMDEVAAQAGLTKGGLYFHFKDKQSLYEAVTLDCIRRIDALMVELGAACSDPEERLRRFFQAMIQEIAGDVECSQAESYPGALEMFMEGHRLVFGRGEIRGIYRRVRGFIAQAVEEGRRQGVFPGADPLLAAVAAVSLWVGLYLQCASDPEAFDLTAVAEAMGARFLDNLHFGGPW